MASSKDTLASTKLRLEEIKNYQMTLRDGLSKGNSNAMFYFSF